MLGNCCLSKLNKRKPADKTRCLLTIVVLTIWLVRLIVTNSWDFRAAASRSTEIVCACALANKSEKTGAATATPTTQSLTALATDAMENIYAKIENHTWNVQVQKYSLIFGNIFAFNFAMRSGVNKSSLLPPTFHSTVAIKTEHGQNWCQFKTFMLEQCVNMPYLA